MADPGSLTYLQNDGGVKSPVPHILYTNEVPSATAVCDIRETIAQTTSMLSSLDARIAALKEELKVLSAERVQMSESLAAHKALLTPTTRRMPPEVMSEVFLHCLPHDDFVEPNPRHAPLLVSQVCARWRSIALSTPRLWCSLHIVDRHLEHSRATGMQRWLSRSGACPLFLRLQESYDHNDTGISCIEVLISHMSRCRKLHLQLPIQVFNVIPQTTFPTLESAHFLLADSPRGADAWTGSSILDAFAMAPLLQSIGTQWHPRISHHPTYFPWSQIGNLALKGISSFRECLEILRQCKPLTTCYLNFEKSCIIGVSMPTSLMVELPRLHTLTITPNHTDIPINDALLDHLIVPALRHLGAVCLKSSCLTNLLTRSGCQLESLELRIQRNFVSTLEDVCSMLDHMSSLVQLDMQELETEEGADIFWNDVVFASMTRRLSYDATQPQPPCLLPKLEVLRLAIVSKLLPSADAVECMLRSRLPSSRIDENHSIERSFPAATFLQSARIRLYNNNPDAMQSWDVVRGVLRDADH